MSLFKCEVCNAVDNTALTNYWTRSAHFWPAAYRDKQLCSECGPPHFVNHDGNYLRESGYGKWHGQFPKRSASGYLIDDEGFLWTKEQVEKKQLPRNRKIIGEVP